MSPANYKCVWASPFHFREGKLNMHTFLVNSSLPFLAALIISLPFVVSLCSRNNRPVIFNFGDSNSDTGGFAAGIGLEDGYPYGRAFFSHRPTGRTNDGRLVIDFLCEYLGTQYLSAYLDSLDRPHFSNGANFAVLGACALQPNIPRLSPFDLNIQILQFKHFQSKMVSKMKEEFFKNALYTIDIGQNDLADSFGALSYAQAIGRVSSFVYAIRDAMKTIYQLGGRKFWVHNTGPLGCLPRELAIRGKLNSSDLDQYGCVRSLNDGAKAFNAKLNALCEELRSQMENSTIVYVDVYSIKYDLIANSTSYGFKNPLMACCGYGGPPYNYDPDSNKTCWTSGYRVCEERVPYINWDGIHYTEAANAIVASKILSTNYSSPPLKFNFFCGRVGTSSTNASRGPKRDS
ncbi:GDSL esterase/lipase lip-4 [Phtheirospermum japonicum]|uniref:GDSL esterase/lipase lip-4 n=1 Tax=Phtheirospermum japonicum TaxID=374723 RepID=A0A830B2F4_9LAMI|nr:GDSL esterase/lipase lip-4 [Phtheirospermum japonicum]